MVRVTEQRGHLLGKELRRVRTRRDRLKRHTAQEQTKVFDSKTRWRSWTNDRLQGKGERVGKLDRYLCKRRTLYRGAADGPESVLHDVSLCSLYQTRRAAADYKAPIEVGE